MVRGAIWRLDWLLLLTTLGLAGIGLGALASAAPHLVIRQIFFVLAGLGVMGLLFLLDYRLLLRYAFEMYALVLGLLVLVFFMPPRRNTYGWIPIGFGFHIQPAELMKLAMVLVLARYLMHRESQATLRGLAIPFLLTMLPMVLLLKQPDLGSAILFPPLLFAVVYASGARPFHLLSIALVGAMSAIPMWFYALRPYQRRRIEAFLDPEPYAATEAYQLLMSLIAIASGGLWGQGWGQGTQNTLDLLPDKHTDFIFGVIAEEGGFVMATLVLLLFLLLVIRGFHIAWKAGEAGGRLIAVGCASILGIQVIINVAVVTALLPTTGITLPFISYGGSSMLTTFAMIGLLLNVGFRRPLVFGKDPFAKGEAEPE